MRKQKIITITAEGRDKGKTFLISEMNAQEAEEWGIKAINAIMQKTDIPAGLMNAGMVGVFILGLKPILSAPFEMVKPLLDEMFDRCLSIMPDPSKPNILRGAGTPKIPPLGSLVPEDMEEVATRVFLRDKIFELHTGFSLAAKLSQAWENVLVVANFLNTPMSPKPSEQSSPVLPS